MTDFKDEFTKKLNDSKIKYVNNLPAKISEITLIWNQLNKDQWRSEVLGKMQSLVHNLSGSGGTFGFPNLSQHAKNLELALGELKAQTDRPPNNEEKRIIFELLAKLQEVELETIRSTPAMPTFMSKADLIYILDFDNQSSLGLSRQLMYYGCTVKIITDVALLETTLHTATPLLILLDDTFAEQKVGKHSVVQALRKKWMINCPIIYISKRDDFEARMAAIKASANAYFTKPVDVPLLIERMHILTNVGLVEPFRILIVEDDTELANYYALVLERGGMKVFVENSPELALSRIFELNPELVVLDLYMPKYNGIDLVKVIRQHQALYTLPLVLLTSEQDVNLQFLAREVGVDDILQKPITEMHLFDSVLNRVQRSRYMNITMTKDSLTGLFVHKKINEYLEIQLNICTRYDRVLSYAIIDVDNFKLVNDTYGHLAGDNILIALANMLKTSVRVTDFVGRYGGEEFVLIFTETPENEALATIERLREEFALINHYSGDIVFNVTFSAGISSYPKFSDIDTIMAAADKALYISKEQGRNRSTIAK